MDFSWLIGILIIVMIFGLALKLLHKMLSAIIITTLILLIATAATGYFIYEDFQDLTTNFPSSTNLFLLKDTSGKLVHGVAMSVNDINGGKLSSIKSLPASTLVEYGSYLNEGNLKKISESGNYYKVLVYSTDLFREIIPETLTPFEEMKMDREEVIDYIKRPDGLDLFLDTIASKQINPSMGIDKDMVVSALKDELAKIGIGDEDEFDTILIMACFSEMFNDFSGPSTLTEFVKQYKKGNIIIYPKTIMFKMISYIPIGIFDSFVNKAKEKVKEKVNERNPLR